MLWQKAKKLLKSSMWNAVQEEKFSQQLHTPRVINESISRIINYTNDPAMGQFNVDNEKKNNESYIRLIIIFPFG